MSQLREGQMLQPVRLDPKPQRPEALPPALRPISVNVPAGGSSGPKREAGGLADYWLMIQRHKVAVAIALLLGGVAGFMNTLAEPRLYRAGATVEIQALNENFLDLKQLNPTDTDSSAYSDIDIQTQVAIMQSASLIKRVATKMVEPAGGTTLPLPDRLSAWRQVLGIAPPTQHELWNRALGSAAGGLKVRNSGLTRILEVSTESTSPKLAADFVNSLADEFIEQNLEARWQSSEHTGEWLTNQLRDLRVKLEKSQDELQNYALANGLLVTSEKETADQTKLADLQKELTQAQADRIGKQSTWEMASASPPDALPSILDDHNFQASRQALLELRRNLAQLRVTFTPNAPEVRKVEAQIAALEAPLAKDRDDLLRRIHNEYDSAANREKLLQAEYERQAHLVSGQTAEMDRYSFLKREVDATRTLYESMLQKLKEASIASALRASNIRVVDRAEVPSAPYKPDVRRSTMMGVIGGICLGIAFAVYREKADRTLQTPGDPEHYLGVAELGVIPLGKLTDAIGDGRQSLVTGAGAGPLPGMELVAYHERTSLVAESFRTTLTSILFSGGSGVRPRVLVVTSASPKEGKTTVVCNLAAALSEVQSAVVLVDADMRRPRLHTVFHLENGPGLSDLLAGTEPLEWETIEPLLLDTGVPGLKLLTSGQSRHKATSLVYSTRMPELMRILGSRFDMTLFDSPPMMNITDARVMGRYADAVIMVVRAGQTTRDAALMAKQRLLDDGSTLMGVILNAWNADLPGYSHYKDYYAGYNHYYSPEKQGRKGKNT
jgi:polysaccharide biosynthesis transport protein